MPDKIDAMNQPNIKAIEEDIRFTRYRLSFQQTTAAALQNRLTALEAQLEQAKQKAA